MAILTLRTSSGGAAYNDLNSNSPIVTGGTSNERGPPQTTFAPLSLISGDVMYFPECVQRKHESYPVAAECYIENFRTPSLLPPTHNQPLWKIRVS